MSARNLLVTLLVTALLTGCSAHATPQRDVDYQAGRNLYQQQHYPAAFARLLAAAKRGHAEAQYAVGYQLYNGLGVAQDQSTAIYWLKRAAAQGNDHAQQALQRLDAQSNPLPR